MDLSSWADGLSSEVRELLDRMAMAYQDAGTCRYRGVAIDSVRVGPHEDRCAQSFAVAAARPARLRFEDPRGPRLVCDGAARYQRGRAGHYVRQTLPARPSWELITAEGRVRMVTPLLPAILFFAEEPLDVIRSIGDRVTLEPAETTVDGERCVALVLASDFLGRTRGEARLVIGEQSGLIRRIERGVSWLWAADPDEPTDPAEPRVGPTVFELSEIALDGELDVACFDPAAVTDGRVLLPEDAPLASEMEPGAGLIAEGEAAPDIALQRGGARPERCRLSDLRGGIVVVRFSDRASNSSLARLADAASIEREHDVTTVAVIHDAPDRPGRWELAPRDAIERLGHEGPVALGEDARAAFTAFGVTDEALPVTYVIDAEGRIRHVGVVLALIGETVGAIRAGVDLEERYALPEPDASLDPGPAFERVWERDAQIGGEPIAIDLVGAGRPALAVAGLDAITLLQENGEPGRRIPLARSSRSTVAVDLDGDGRRELLVGGHWGHEVHALADDGSLLWTVRNDHGLDDLAAVRWGERTVVAIGYNGSGGLCAHDGADGRLLWAATDIGNCWRVVAGAIDGEPRIACTEAHGAIHVFDLEGRRVGTWRREGGYHHDLLLGSFEPGGPDLLLADDRDPARVVGFDAAGRIAFEAELPVEELLGPPPPPPEEWLDPELAGGASLRAYLKSRGHEVPEPSEERRREAIASMLEAKVDGIALGDVDGDGRRELVLALTRRTFRSPTAIAVIGQDGRVRGALPPQPRVAGFAVADADGDDRDELLVATERDSSTRLTLLRRRGARGTLSERAPGRDAGAAR